MKDKSEKTNLAYQDAKTETGGSYSEAKLAAIQLPPLAGKRFLDLGCNAGFYCGKAHEHGATRVLGVDLDPNIIKVAGERHPGCEFRDGGWDRFPEGEFDIVICLSAIHYARDFLTLGANIHSALSPEGVFILEGGLLDPEGKLFTDIPIPVWRKVGDRCRHLSHGFLTRHLLRGFDWKIVSDSVARGGDPIKRFLIHAKRGVAKSQVDAFQVDIEEFARCVALSAETIVEAQPSYGYVRDLGRRGDITSQVLSRVLEDPGSFGAFVDDLSFAVGAQRPVVVRLRGSDSSLVAKVGRALEEKGIAIEGAVSPAASQAGRVPEDKGIKNGVSPGMLKSMADYLEILDTIPNNLKEGKLQGKSVVDLSSSDSVLTDILLSKGVASCYVRQGSPDASGPDANRIRPVSDLANADTERADVALFDARTVPGFDSVQGVVELLEEMESLLKPDGTAFCILQGGTMNPDVDVVNSVVMTGSGPMPSSPYFFESLLKGFAVRVLANAINYETGVITRLVRITRKKPSLLLIFARSESGKTTLARDLKAHDHHSHLSNDYVFVELIRLKNKGLLDWVPGDLVELPDRAEVRSSCGHFNRALEADPVLFKAYLELVASLIPRDKDLVSMDFDLRDEKNFPIARDFFASKGYSVWIVTR